MAVMASASTAKVSRDLSPNARALLMSIAQDAQVLPRLNGAPLELIGRQLAIYASGSRGYALAITERGAQIVKGLQSSRA